MTGLQHVHFEAVGMPVPTHAPRPDSMIVMCRHPLFRSAVKQVATDLLGTIAVSEAGTFSELTDLLEAGGQDVGQAELAVEGRVAAVQRVDVRLLMGLPVVLLVGSAEGHLEHRLGGVDADAEAETVPKSLQLPPELPALESLSE